MKQLLKVNIFCWLIPILLSISSCAISPPYDAHVFKETTDLKVDALKLMNRSVYSFKSQEEKIELFNDRLDKICEYEFHRRHNGIRNEMWNKLRNPDGHLLGGFFTRWEKEEKLNKSFVTEAKKQIGEAFDQLADLESGKKKP
jgi:hypothetical protein